MAIDRGKKDEEPDIEEVLSELEHKIDRLKILYEQFFMGIEKVRYYQPVRPGDVVEIEAVVKRLRSRVGILKGVGRVNGAIVVEGTMTFALGPRGGHQPDE